MYCLRCQTNMAHKVLHGVLIDFCEHCHSFWLDSGELDRLRRGESKSVEELQKQARKERRYSVGHSYIKGTCPRCSGMLSVSYEGGVQLERCLVCNGLFFDYGELDACLKMEADNWFQRIVKRIFGA